MNDLPPTHYPKPSLAFSATAELTVELAKMLALVAPSSMTSEQQELWLRAAVDALEDIRGQEVAEISAEIRRSVTRHNQIVPEISKLVAEHRKRRARASEPIPEIPAPPPLPPAPPLTRGEIAKLSPTLVQMGLKCGALAERDGQIVNA